VKARAYSDSIESGSALFRKNALQQAEITQLATQPFRHVARARRNVIEIARRIGSRKIAPALEGSPRSRLDQRELRLKQHAAATHAVLVDERNDIEDALAADHLTADHPIERAARHQLGSALGHHAGGVDVLARQAAALALLEPLPDPGLEILNAVTPHAELDEMQRGGRASTSFCQSLACPGVGWADAAGAAGAAEEDGAAPGAGDGAALLGRESCVGGPGLRAGGNGGAGGLALASGAGAAGCGPDGSGAMMLTGGIEADDGKKRFFLPFAAAAADATGGELREAAGGVLALATGVGGPDGAAPQSGAWRAISNS
jgi:hypothetical protein